MPGRREPLDQADNQAEPREPSRPEYHRVTRAIAVLTVFLVTAGGVGSSGASSDDAAEGRIAFAVEVDGDLRLVTANADGSGDLTVLRHLTEVLGNETKWSPDGQKIASTDGDGLWVINADGTGLREVVAGYSPEAGFAWSPDGGRLAFFERPGLYVEDADGANRRLIVRCDCKFDSQVAWSPDGGTIAYSDSAQIHLVHPDGTGERALTRSSTGGALSPELSWSPDGNQIAFTRPPFPYVRGSDGIERANTAKPDLYVISTDGSGERRLGLGDYHLSWSPDGTQIAVRRDFGRPSPTGKFGVPSRKNGAIWVWNGDGSGGRQIWPREGFCHCAHPAWQPD
jgi:Tol biopolymer transport system component